MDGRGHDEELVAEHVPRRHALAEHHLHGDGAATGDHAAAGPHTELVRRGGLDLWTRERAERTEEGGEIARLFASLGFRARRQRGHFAPIGDCLFSPFT